MVIAFFPNQRRQSLLLLRCRFVLSEARKVSTRWADVERKEFQSVMSQSFHNSVLTLMSQMERNLCLHPRALEQHRRRKWKGFDSGGCVIIKFSQRKGAVENQSRKWGKKGSRIILSIYDFPPPLICAIYWHFRMNILSRCFPSNKLYYYFPLHADDVWRS